MSNVTRAMFNAQVTTASVAFDSLRALDSDMIKVYAKVTDVVTAVDKDEMTLSVGYNEISKIIAEMMALAEKADKKSKVGEKLGEWKDAAAEKAKDTSKAAVDACWDASKKGLTKTGKVVVGAAVAGTVGAIGFGIKSLWS